MPNTPNHGANLPTVGADSDSWGTENNSAHNFWDALTSGAQNTFLGRIASGSGPMKQLSQAEATSALAAVVGDSGSGGTKGLVPAPAAGDALAGKVLGAGGAFVSPAAAIGRFVGSTGATVVTRGVTCTRTGTGLFTLALSPVMANTNYIIQIVHESATFQFNNALILTKTTSGFTIETRIPASLQDPDFLNVVVLVV